MTLRSARSTSIGWLTAGTLTWASAVGLSARSRPGLSLIDLILVFAALVVIPLARPLLIDVWFPPASAIYVAGLLFAAAFINAPHGLGGAALALPWLGLAGVVLAAELVRVLLQRSWTPVAVAHLAACAFLVVGASFAVASRAGWIVAGIGEPIVELTGVHFNYAGFATITLVSCLAGRLPNQRRLTIPLIVLACAAPLIVAGGFTWTLAPLQIGGAIVMTIVTWSVAALTVFLIAPHVDRVRRALLIFSSCSVLAPMALALFWASAQYYNVAALSISDMARIHGTLNAFGFVTCGLLGWRYASEER